MKENKIKVGFPEKYGEVSIVECSMVYSQEKDDCQDDNDIQQLSISIADGGAGTYFVIKTDRWAFDDLDSLVNTINDFKKRMDL